MCHVQKLLQYAFTSFRIYTKQYTVGKHWLQNQADWEWGSRRRYQMSEYILSCLVARYTNYNKPLHLHIVKANSILIKILWDSIVGGYRQHRNTNKCYLHSKYLCQTWKKFLQCHNPFWEGRIHKSLKQLGQQDVT